MPRLVALLKVNATRSQAVSSSGPRSRIGCNTFVAPAAQALNVLQPILDRGPDQETDWLLSRVYLQERDKTRALAALKQAGSYRAANPLEPEPSQFVGEARCERCHPAIFRDSLASRHTQTYYRGSQLAELPLPDGLMPDPDDPEVTHAFQKQDGCSAKKHGSVRSLTR